MNWTHDNLARDLASYLRSISDRMVWTDMQLGSMHSMRPDVYTLNKSYSKPKPMAYECKISMADFRSDITSGKWQKYLEAACGVIFAVPKGLVTKADIPKGCGLMVRGDDTWTVVKGPTLQPCTLSQELLLKLLIDGVDRLRRDIKPRTANHWTLEIKHRLALAKDYSQFVSDKERSLKKLHESTIRIDALKNEIAELQKERDADFKKMKEDAIKSLNDDARYVSHDISLLRRSLGLPLDANTGAISRAIHRLRGAANEDDRLVTARNAVTLVREQMDAALERLSI